MKLYIVTILLLVGYSSHAQEVWTLEDCIAYAFENSIEVRQADIDISEAEIITKLSEQSLLPYLDAGTRTSLGVGRTIDPTSNDFINSNILSSNVRLSSGVTVYNGGRLKSKIDQSRKGKEVIQAQKQVLMFHLIIRIINEYFKALLAEDYYSIIEKQLESINEQIHYLNRLVVEGSRAQYELIELRAQHANIERRLLFAGHDKIGSMIDLKATLNLDQQKMLILVAPPDPAYNTSIDSLSMYRLAERAEQASPELHLYDLLQEKGDIEIKLAEGLIKPIVNFSATIGSNFSSSSHKMVGTTSILNESEVFINGNSATFGQVIKIPGSVATIPYPEQLYNNLSFGFSLNIAIPIYDNYKSRGARDQAQLRLEKIQSEKEQWRLDLAHQMSRYVNQTFESLNNLNASHKLLSIRKLAMENALKRFQHGVISSYDFIDIRENLSIAEVELLIAKYEYMRIRQIVDFYKEKSLQRFN